jgi:ribose-phosphate pyrophosphokinase
MIRLNGKPLEFKQFPNGEIMLDINDVDDYVFCNEVVMVDFRFETNADLFELLILKKYLDDTCKKSKGLFIAYMPYSRMDRVSEAYAFTLKFVADFINSLNFDKVLIGEPHSDVTPALINRSLVSHYIKYLLPIAEREIGFDPAVDYIYWPDVTAEKRYSKITSNPNQIIGMKERDFKTGKITGLKTYGEIKGVKPKVIMVDDLCSRGGTFIMGARMLKEQGAGDIYLVVGHCESTIFDGEILTTDLIKKVYTTNSIIPLQNAKEDSKIFTKDIF